MKRFLILSLLVLLGVGCQQTAKDPGATFYLQLVRGNDQDAPPVPGCKPIGPNLSQRLQCVLKWQHYWELNRDCVQVKSGQKVRRRLSPEQEVEIQLLDAQHMATRIYRNGALSRSRRGPVAGAFYITGGDQADNQSWFIVVRQDKPGDH